MRGYERGERRGEKGEERRKRKGEGRGEEKREEVGEEIVERRRGSYRVRNLNCGLKQKATVCCVPGVPSFRMSR
jgi:hypothetical protein